MTVHAAAQPVVIAIDAGTTGVRALALDATGTPLAWSYREFAQHFPQPGWVEHDASEIWRSVQAVLADVVATLPESLAIAAVGITNQRETVVAFDRRSGVPHGNAIVWQDRRTAARCDELMRSGALDDVRRRTGLVIDPYFSATKLEWLLHEGGVARDAPGLALGTIDAWIAWNLTGHFATDPSNASRTMLYDIVEHRWSDDLCARFGVPLHTLPTVLPSCGRFGVVRDGVAPPRLTGVPVSAILGDQQSALFGQACLSPGMAKNTYGTGSFVLMNIGRTCPPPAAGLLTTIAWDLGPVGAGGVTYALEGAVFVTGAAIQWLRDGLGIIASAADISSLAASVPDSNGVYVVPAFTGLGSPWWDPYARGSIVGVSAGVGRAHLARAVLESITYQVRDVVERMAEVSGTALAELRVDGGAAASDLLLQLQADQLRVAVTRPTITETTALGAALAAGLAEGVWSGADDVQSAWSQDARFTPSSEQHTLSAADAAHAGWRRALDRSRRWSAVGEGE